VTIATIFARDMLLRASSRIRLLILALYFLTVDLVLVVDLLYSLLLALVFILSLLHSLLLLFPFL
jgi:hypothetical protein